MDQLFYSLFFFYKFCYLYLLHLLYFQFIFPQGKLKKTEEHVVEGFDNMFDAFLGLFRGDNIGKILVKA